MERSHYTVKASEVIGVEVKSQNLENLGKITDLLLDKFTGKVRYAVLSFGGFLSLGDKLFAVPWNALHYQTDKDVFVLNTHKDKLKTAPGFDKDHWPDTTQQAWQQSIENFYATSSLSSKVVAEEETLL